MANLKTEAGRPKIFSSDVDKDATPEVERKEDVR
jgi:hypothetical protein